MSATQNPIIPYEKQADPRANRMCGAAALSMVYRSFGQEITQAELWPKIARNNQVSSRAAATHLIAHDALKRGFAALAIQAKHPLQALRACQDHGIRVILNHRLKYDAAAGHFTVLVALDGDHVVLHDPYYGPSRRVSHTDLLELWQPRYLNAEIVGNVLIGIAAQPTTLPPCSLCGTGIPPHIDCPRCAKPIPLQPAALLSCMGAGCAARLWNYLCCPFCDYTWTFHLEAAPTPTPAGSEEDLWKLQHLFGELNKFCEHILSLPAAAKHPDVRKQIDFIKASQDKLQLAQSEELVRRKAQQARTTQLQQKFKQEEEVILKKREEINQPTAPLDGTALGQALLKDLGLLGPVAESPRPPQPAAESPRPPQPAPPVRKPAAASKPAPEARPFDPHGTWFPETG